MFAAKQKIVTSYPISEDGPSYKAIVTIYRTKKNANSLRVVCRSFPEIGLCDIKICEGDGRTDNFKLYSEGKVSRTPNEAQAAKILEAELAK